MVGITRSKVIQIYLAIVLSPFAVGFFFHLFNLHVFSTSQVV